jgi:hypothetical protein
MVPIIMPSLRDLEKAEDGNISEVKPEGLALL